MVSQAMSDQQRAKDLLLSLDESNLIRLLRRQYHGARKWPTMTENHAAEWIERVRPLLERLSKNGEAGNA